MLAGLSSTGNGSSNSKQPGVVASDSRGPFEHRLDIAGLTACLAALRGDNSCRIWYHGIAETAHDPIAQLD